MRKSYEDFVDEFCKAMQGLTGFEQERFVFKRKEETEEPGDRLFIELMKYEDASEVCGLHIKELYKQYLEDYEQKELFQLYEIESSDIIGELARDFYSEIESMLNAGFYETTKKLEEYESAKPYLYVRLLNFDIHEKELKNVVHQRIEDIALVLYMRVGEVKDRVTSVKIRKSYVEKWGMDEEEILRIALLNTYFFAPPRIFQWEKMIMNPNYEGENFMNIFYDYEMKRNEIGNCLSTTKRVNGAVAIFLPGVAERICALMKSDIYLVFTSIHEVMVHSDETIEPKDLEKILKDTILEATPEEDYLTSYIYHYNNKTKKFSCVSKKLNTNDIQPL